MEHLPYILLAIIGGFAGDRVHQAVQRLANGNYITFSYQTFNWIWHIVNTTIISYAFYWFALTNGVLPWAQTWCLGIITITAYTFVFGYIQSDRTDWLHYGDMFRSPDEFVLRMLTHLATGFKYWGYCSQSILFKMRYKSIAFVVRLIVMIVCIVYFLTTKN